MYVTNKVCVMILHHLSCLQNNVDQVKQGKSKTLCCREIKALSNNSLSIYGGSSEIIENSKNHVHGGLEQTRHSTRFMYSEANYECKSQSTCYHLNRKNNHFRKIVNCKKYLNLNLVYCLCALFIQLRMKKQRC